MKAEELLPKIEPFLNPILVKEVRGTVREVRFVILHLLMLLVAGVTSIIVFLNLWASYIQSPERYNPASAGQDIYEAMQLLQIVILFCVGPGLASTLISSEKDRNTFEMLLSTAVSPLRILMGKLLAALSLLGLIFASLMPLVALTFLFGGIEIGHVLRFYIFLGMLAALVTTFCICLSSVSRSSSQSVIGSYAGSILMGTLLPGLFGLLQVWGVREYALTVFGFVKADYEFPGLLAGPRQVLAGLLFPLYCWTAIVSLCLIAAFNGLKPPFANRATPLRVYYLLTACLGILLLAALSRMDEPARSAPTSVAIILVFPISLSAFFVFDDLVQPEHARSRLSRLLLLRILSPGVLPAIAYDLTANTILSAVFAAAFASINPQTAFGCAEVLFTWSLFTAGLAALLRGAFDDRFLTRFLFVIVLAILMIVPSLVSFYAIGYEPNPVGAMSPLVTLTQLSYNPEWVSLFERMYGPAGLGMLLVGVLLVRRRIAALAR